MKITIDSEVLEKYKLTSAQFFYLLALQKGISEEEINSLKNQKFHISDDLTNKSEYLKHVLTHKGVNMVNTVILESETSDIKSKNRLEELTKTLQSMFPEGRKQGTNNYWRGNFPEIKDRLQAFFKKFGDYPDQVIIDATRRYIEAFQNNQTTMRTLKYFISKKDGGEWSYDLLTWIENANSENSGIMETQRLI